MLAAILDRDPAPLARFEPDAPPELQRIVTKTLRKDRAQRYQTMQDLLLDLQALRDDIQSRHTPGPAVPPQQPLTRVKRRKGALILGSLLLLVGIAVGVWWVASKRRGTTELPQREPVLTQLTANPMELPVTSVAISPDGRYLAYADPSGIKVRHIDTGETQSIPDTRRMNVYAWTGDSTKGTSHRLRCSVVCRLGHLAGGKGTASFRRELASDQFVLAAPDGSRLLRFTESGFEIHLLNGTPPLVIKTEVALAAWSADGRRVLFSKDGFSLQSIAIDGGQAVTVFTPAQRQRITDAIELPDHRIIVSMTRPGDPRFYRAGPEVRLWELHTDSAGVAVGPPRRLTEAYDHIQGLSASRDGTRLAIVRVAFQSDIYIAEFEPRTGLTASPRRLTLDDRDDTPASWTPDSSTVIFESSRNGTLDILKQRIDSDVAEPFVVGPRDQTLPRVTSDGKWVLYSEAIQPGKMVASCECR